MSILKLLFALNPKNLRLVKAAEMTPKMAQEIDSFLGKMGAVVNIGKYELTPGQAKYWRAQRKELTKYENKLKELIDRNKLSKKEGIETLPEADIIDFPVKPKPPEGEPFAKGGVIGGKKDEEEEIEDDDPGMFDDLFDRMFGEYELEKLKKSGRKPNADGGRVGLMAGGIPKIKKLLDLAKKTKSKLGEAPKTDVSKVRARAAADKKSIEDLAKSEQIPVRNDTVKVKGEVMEDGTPDYEYYSEILDDAENQFVKGNETLEQLEKMVKEKDDYMKYMYGQYKAGKLGSNIGDDVKNISDTEISKAYKQAREGNDLDLNDDKYDAQIIADYLSNNLYKTDFYDLPKDAQLDIYDKSLMWLLDDKMEKAMRAAKPMKGPIDMTTGKNMITGEKVIDVDYIPGETPLPKKRTLNADGGLATLFEER